MIKSIVGFINGTITMKSQSNQTIYLSDGTQWNKKKFHHDRMLIKAFMLREVSKDPEVQAVQAEIQALRVTAITRYGTLRNEMKQQMQKFQQPAIDPKLEMIERLRKHQRLMSTPYCNNTRFICGRTDAGQFEMIFWNHNKQYSNSHSDLETMFLEVCGVRLYNIRGGFYITGSHNNSTGNTVYLFGRSDTYGHFEDHIPDIRDYAAANGFQVIFGKTNFSHDRDETDIITTHFKDYDTSNEDRLPF